MKIGLNCAVLFLIWSVNPWPMFGQTRAIDAEDCTLRSNSKERIRCFDEFARRTKELNHTSDLPGGWRLVRTPNPNGGADTVSVMHISDTSKSDLALAGLTLRCSRTGGTDVLLVLIEPLDSKSRPTVTIKTDTTQTVFEAMVVQAGEAVVLPKPASEEALKAWQKASELQIGIASGPRSISGRIEIEGLARALQALSGACVSR
jgi:hypothetical protein